MMSNPVYFGGLMSLFVGMALAGCGNPERGSSQPATLSIAAASDLGPVLPKLIRDYQSRNASEVIFTLGASGQLARQVRQGAPFDLFLSADRKFVTDLADAGIIRPESVRPYAIGSLVVVHRRDGGTVIRQLADLDQVSIKRIALADPVSAPYGRAARQALEHTGLWERLEPRIVFADSVRQALQYVESGNAEAGLVSGAISDVPDLLSIPVAESLHEPIVQTMGIVASSTQHARAERFSDYLRGPNARAILQGSGFRLLQDDHSGP